jgi:hypothetical protein
MNKALKSIGLVVVGLAVLVGSAQALLITAGTTTPALFGDNNSQSEINALIAPLVGSTAFDYKGIPAGNTEDGPFASSYTTTYGIGGLDVASFQITYDGGSFISGGDIYLLVKDGNNSPNWYLYDITGWNGQETIQGQNFFSNQGNLSHVSIYGNGGSRVPDGGMTLVLLGSSLTGLAFFARSRKISRSK